MKTVYLNTLQSFYKQHNIVFQVGKEFNGSVL